LDTDNGAALPRCCERIFEDFLACRGDPSGELDRVLDQNPELLFGQCLRAAIIVRGDDVTHRSRLAKCIAAIEESCRHVDDWACRHASAARAWLDGNHALAVERYGAIVVDFPRDLVALKSSAPDLEKAEACFERALSVARQQQAKYWELRAATSMARLWRDQGKRDEA
jgi:hypothetical protein